MVNYEDLGVKKIINAAGTYTKYSGSLMNPLVLEAMTEAAKDFVDIEELLEKSGKYIANLLDVEGALITSGAAAGLALATAACIAGDDLGIRNSLPKTEGLANEIIVMKSHRCPYDQAMITVGAEFVEIGNAIDTHPWELEAAIGEKTAAVAYFVQSDMLESSLPLDKVIEIIHAHNLPVLVDAAAELPPVENLKKFTKMGADIVVFSGGKDIRGPQSSGLMLGKKEIIDISRFHGYPHHAIGRPMKLDKETIIGLVTALELYLKEDHQSKMEKWEQQIDTIVAGLKTISDLEVKKDYGVQPITQPAITPRAYCTFSKKSGITKEEVVEELYQGEPAIAIMINKKSLVINSHMLQEGEEEIVIQRLREVLNKFGLK